MTKLCTNCDSLRDLTEFFANKGTKDGLGSWCKPCQANYNKAYYKRSKHIYSARLKRYRKSTKDKINEFKAGKPCTDCKTVFKPVCMDFDHVDSTTKQFAIAEFASKSWNTVLTEIEKCELVCANCHRLRTEKRRMPALV